MIPYAWLRPAIVEMKMIEGVDYWTFGGYYIEINGFPEKPKEELPTVDGRWLLPCADADLWFGFSFEGRDKWWKWCEENLEEDEDGNTILKERH